MLPSLQILLVDDNPINQKVAARLLEKAGHSVTLAGNGREAISFLNRQPFDIILMDVQMPEMDGLEATSAIRKLELGTDRHLPIIALTANTTQADRNRCLEAGMDAYVPKPVQAPVLFQAIADALGSTRQAV